MSAEVGTLGDYIPAPVIPVICRRCGASVDRAFTPEHDRFHAALAALVEAARGGDRS